VSDTDKDGVDPRALHEVLLEAREAGFLGPGPIERHLLHAHGFVKVARAQPGPDDPQLLDLGSGGGLPGLVVAGGWPAATMVLLEANDRRAQFLLRAVVQCGLEDRVRVLHERAEVAGRDPSYRGTFDGAVVRSFGPPAVVAECAAPLLRGGGWLLVSEPPNDQEEGAGNPQLAETSIASDRWPAEELAPLGLRPVESVRAVFGYQLLRQETVCPERFPRRNGIPAKRPLF
jgi:16S rRNA (guanine527-N7)-methyltransferase